jgi:hypothetical protein
MAFWKLPTKPRRLTKGQLLTFTSRWAPRTVKQMSDLPTTYVPGLSSNGIPQWLTRTFSHPVTFLLLFHRVPLYPPQACTQQWALAVLLKTPPTRSFLNKACADRELPPTYPSMPLFSATEIGNVSSIDIGDPGGCSNQGSLPERGRAWAVPWRNCV